MHPRIAPRRAARLLPVAILAISFLGAQNARRPLAHSDYDAWRMDASSRDVSAATKALQDAICPPLVMLCDRSGSYSERIDACANASEAPRLAGC